MIHILLTYLLSTNSKNTKSTNEKSQNLERDLYYMKIILDQILPGVYHPLPSYQTTNTTLNYIQVAWQKGPNPKSSMADIPKNEATWPRDTVNVARTRTGKPSNPLRRDTGTKQVGVSWSNATSWFIAGVKESGGYYVVEGGSSVNRRSKHDLGEHYRCTVTNPVRAKTERQNCGVHSLSRTNVHEHR